MNRGDLVETVCRFVHSESEAGGLRRTCPTGQAVIDAVEPLIRADLRARVEMLVIKVADGPGAIQQVLGLIDGGSE